MRSGGQYEVPRTTRTAGSGRYGCQPNATGTRRRPVGTIVVLTSRPALRDADCTPSRCGNGKRGESTSIAACTVTARAGRRCCVTRHPGAPTRRPWMGSPLASACSRPRRRSTSHPPTRNARRGECGSPTAQATAVRACDRRGMRPVHPGLPGTRVRARATRRRSCRAPGGRSPSLPPAQRDRRFTAPSAFLDRGAFGHEATLDRPRRVRQTAASPLAIVHPFTRRPRRRARATASRSSSRCSSRSCCRW